MLTKVIKLDKEKKMPKVTAEIEKKVREHYNISSDKNTSKVEEKSKKETKNKE